MVKPTRGPRPDAAAAVLGLRDRCATGRAACIGLSLLNKRVGVGTSLLYDARPGDRIGVPRPARPAVRAGRSAGGGLDGGRRRRTRAVRDAGRSARRARHVDDALLRRAHRRRTSTTRIASSELGAHARPHDRGRQPRRARPRHARRSSARSTSAAPPSAVTIYACGPTPMMRAVAAARRRAPARPVFVSLEPVMGCGMGGCYSCVVPVRHGARQSLRPLVPRGPGVRRDGRRLGRALRRGIRRWRICPFSIGSLHAAEPDHRGVGLLRLRRRVRGTPSISRRSAAWPSKACSSTSARAIRRRASSRRRPACSTRSACRASASIASSPRSCPSCAGSARRRSSTSADRRSTSTARSRACCRITRASARSSSTSRARTSRKAASSSAAA